MQPPSGITKSSPPVYPRDEIAAQATCAERLNHFEFWQASHGLCKISEPGDACGGGYDTMKYAIKLQFPPCLASIISIHSYSSQVQPSSYSHRHY
jgi:hypothetical protein